MINITNKMNVVIIGNLYEEDKEISIDIYKLISMGYKNKRYYWCDIISHAGAGIGFGLDEDVSYKSIDEAYTALVGFFGDYNKAMIATFDEVMVEYNKIKDKLNEKLQSL